MFFSVYLVQTKKKMKNKNIISAIKCLFVIKVAYAVGMV
jgi:hypothetical protein